MLPEFCRPRRYPRISAGWDCNTFWRMAALAIFQNGSRTTPQSQAAAPDRWRSRIFDARIVVYPIEYDRDLFACIESPTRKQTKQPAGEWPSEPCKTAAKSGFKMIVLRYLAQQLGASRSGHELVRAFAVSSIVFMHLDLRIKQSIFLVNSNIGEEGMSEHPRYLVRTSTTEPFDDAIVCS